MVNPLNKIVKVDVSQLLAPKPKVRYMILVDKTPAEVIETARRYPEVFIYTFLTMPKDDMPNYSILEDVDSEDKTLFICAPTWIGNFEDANAAISKIVSDWHSSATVVNMGLPCEYEQVVP